MRDAAHAATRAAVQPCRVADSSSLHPPSLCLSATPRGTLARTTSARRKLANAPSELQGQIPAPTRNRTPAGPPPPRDRSPMRSPTPKPSGADMLRLQAPTSDLFEVAFWSELAHFEGAGDDCEGADLCSRAPSPDCGNATHIKGIGDDFEGVELRSRAPSPGDEGAKAHAHSANPGASNKPGHKVRRKTSKQARRSQSRCSAAIQRQSVDYRPKISTVKLHKAAAKFQGRINARVLSRSQSGSWIGRRSTGIKETPWELDDLVNNHGFTELPYTGRPMFIVDEHDRIIAAVAESPSDPQWPDVQNGVMDVMEEVLKLGLAHQVFDQKDLRHRRGKFAALASGISFGGGQKRPGTLRHLGFRRRLVRMLLANRSVQRVAGFQSSALALYAPKLFQYYANTLDSLCSHDPSLERNFRNSVFPASTFNCGPRTISLDHTDYGNLSHGLCALTAFGDFDYTRGGHMILFELKVAIQFPPGCTILIPSSAIRHANVPIRDGERRYSIAQYAAGGLFRWVAYGHRSAKSLVSEAGKEGKDEIDGAENVRWQAGIDMFSKYDELEVDSLRIYYGAAEQPGPSNP